MMNEMGFKEIVAAINSSNQLKHKNDYKFSLLGVDYSIINPDSDFLDALKTEYSYFMESFKNNLNMHTKNKPIVYTYSASKIILMNVKI